MKKLLIWGTGNFAKRFIDNQYNGEIIGFIESDKSKAFFMGEPVYDCHEIPEDYDYIIVANSYTAEIYDLCKKLKICLSKVIFLYGVNNKKSAVREELCLLLHGVWNN